MAKNTIYNINGALERFLTFISGKQLHLSKIIIIRHKQILYKKLHLNCLYGVQLAKSTKDTKFMVNLITLKSNSQFLQFVFKVM